MHVNIGTEQIENSNSEKLLGIHIDSKLSFEKHKNTICREARAKLSLSGRVAPYMNIEKRKNNYECLFQFRIQLLSFNMGVL